jgi:F0F1-type ATP synthase assembly protein I
VAGEGSSGAELAGLGALLAGALVIPLLGGLKVDDAFHTTPLGLVLGLVLGIVACCGSVYVRYR